MPRSILMVEDDPRFSDAFAAAIASADDLRLAGTAATLADGKALLDALDPDVMLVDLGLPDGNGIELIRRAAEHHPNCETLVVTIFEDDTSVFTSLCAGATGYLLKDSRPIDIVEQIRRLCEGGSPLSPQIARRLLARFAERSGPREAPAGSLLSKQELTVLTFSAKGCGSEEIAGLMNLSYHTVETYTKRIYRKLQVHSRAQAIHEAQVLGLIGR